MRREVRLLPWKAAGLPSQLPETPARPGGVGWGAGRGKGFEVPEDLLTLDPVTLMLRHNVQQHVPAPPTHTWETSRRFTKLTQQRNTNGSQRDRQKVLCLIKCLFASEKEGYLAFQIHWDPSSCLS